MIDRLIDRERLLVGLLLLVITISPPRIFI